jgi:ketosteroid isomerase-like protein
MTFILWASVLAQDNEEARVKAAVEARCRESIAAANKKDTAAMTNLYDDNAVLMPPIGEGSAR